jgi:hypothetical protein
MDWPGYVGAVGEVTVGEGFGHHAPGGGFGEVVLDPVWFGSGVDDVGDRAD